jgi:NADH-ubiquinone oxidoreductase chain 5
MGDLVLQAPVATSCIFVANSALCGLPFMAGFYSKDLIIELIISGHFNFILMCLSYISVGFTAFYSLRFRASVIWSPRNHAPLHYMQENHLAVGPILLIAATSVIGGACLTWLLPLSLCPIILNLNIKLITLIIVGVGIGLGWYLTLKTPIKSILDLGHTVNYARCAIWFLVPLASQFQLIVPFKVGHLILKTVDTAWLELMGGQGTHKLVVSAFSIIVNHNSSRPMSLLSYSILAGLTLFIMTIIIC